MKAYFDSIEKEVPEGLREVFLDRHDTAVITIDMHDGHLSTDPDCPCPSPRGREIDLHRKRRMGVAGENFDIFSVRNH